MLKGMKKEISYEIGGSILFDKICSGENILLFYNNATDYNKVLKNFMRQMLGEHCILFYVSHSTNKPPLVEGINTFFFNVINENVIRQIRAELEKQIKDARIARHSLFLVCDWSKADLGACPGFLHFLEDLIKMAKGMSILSWKRRYKNTNAPSPFLLINAFESNGTSDKFIQSIIPLHQRVYILHERGANFLLPTLSPTLDIINPKMHVLPQQVLEKLAKDNLELIALLLLEKGSCSGYQVLKDIADHFHCVLSQGTLYPLLYQLEKQNKISRQNGKGREIIYALNPEAKEELLFRKQLCLKSYQHLAGFFGVSDSETESETALRTF